MVNDGGIVINYPQVWTKLLLIMSLPSPAWAEGTVLCVCVLPQNCCLNSIITKFKQVAALKLGNLRQTVALYKIG